jgi:RNA polymerase sigma-70 factor (ECF subfamily)
MALVGSQHQADDLTQDTLLRAHDSWDTYRREGSPRSWLLTIARRRCARHLERRDPRGAELHLVPAQEPLEDELLARYRRATRARRALQQLRPTDREALLLRYGFELTYEELASACAIEESAARQRVSRALVRLREVLGQEEQSHEQ